ncbi:hypothetical protein J6590_024184 [Homalodisca vitripennis]|nr:hypothetical protein J6590_024184 [Homalodisca vitripennis]
MLTKLPRCTNCRGLPLRMRGTSPLDRPQPKTFKYCPSVCLSPLVSTCQTTELNKTVTRGCGTFLFCAAPSISECRNSASACKLPPSLVRRDPWPRHKSTPSSWKSKLKEHKNSLTNSTFVYYRSVRAEDTIIYA